MRYLRVDRGLLIFMAGAVRCVVWMVMKLSLAGLWGPSHFFVVVLQFPRELPHPEAQRAKPYHKPLFLCTL